MSAIGSVNIYLWCLSLRSPERSDGTNQLDGKCAGFSIALPGTLGHAGDRALVRELAEADPAETELAIDRTRPAAAAAARVVAHAELLGTPGLRDQGFLGHYSVSPSACVTAGNGIPRPRRSASASSLSFAVVVIATSSPRIVSTSS